MNLIEFYDMLFLWRQLGFIARQTHPTNRLEFGIGQVTLQIATIHVSWQSIVGDEE